MKQLAIFGSTRGTHLTAIVKAIEEKRLAADIAMVVSNKKDALILEKGRALSVPTFFLDPLALSRHEYDDNLSQLCKEHAIDYIVLIGYMRILSSVFVNAWHHRIINIHPSLLPKHAGKMDLAVHQSVLDAKEKETGCTVHYVTAEVDCGPVLLQKKCEVLQDDTAERLKKRVQTLESDALVDVLLTLC